MSQRELLEYVFKNDPAPIACIESLFEISQILDDLWDKDKPLKDTAAANMVMIALVDIPSNPFFQAYQQIISLFIKTSILRWIEANDIEATKENLNVSHITRSSTTTLLIDLVYLHGGNEWGRECALKINQWVFNDNESLEEYTREHS